MRKLDLNLQSPRKRGFRFGMAFGRLRVFAVRLALTTYILAVALLVRASGNWDRDDDLGSFSKIIYNNYLIIIFVFGKFLKKRD